MAADATLLQAAADGLTDVPEPTGPAAQQRHERLRGGIQPVPTPEPGSPPPAVLSVLVGDPPASEIVIDGLVARAVSLPTTWEREGFPKTLEGPVWFAARVVLGDGQAAAKSATWVLRFGAVSYFSTIWVDGARVADHRGMWDPFDVDVTDHIGPGSVIAVEVYKPWSRFPVRESLAGFIPYVTTTFGGPWQPVELVARGALSVTDAWVRTDPAGVGAVAYVSVSSDTPRSRVAISVSASSDRAVEVRQVVDVPAGDSTWELGLEALELPWWSPAQPTMARLITRVEHEAGSDSRALTASRRTVGADGTRLLLNGRPVYPRGVLHWMAYPDRFAPDPPRERVESELRSIKALGYSMVKLCLVLPPEHYFDVADELGILLWVELPMWLPRVTDGYEQQAVSEYRAMVRRIRNHPSVLLYTLGCELSSEANAELLERLYRLVKVETGGALVRDNSGSAEAYGGIVQEYADFSDYHFYAEAHVFYDLMDHFLPAWKPARPLLFGEYCDSDTFRSVAEIESRLDHDPFWADDDPVRNPQGVRWDYHVVTNRERLAVLSIGIPFEQIKQRSYQRSIEYRKSILEQTRLHHATTGYVVTNIQDTPVTTSGMLDDFGDLKFDPAGFGRFNADTVLLVTRDRRRAWRAGGDRRQFLDEHCIAPGEMVHLNLICSHFGTDAIERPKIEWRIDPGVIAEGGSVESEQPLLPGTTTKLGEISFTVGESAPSELTVRLALTDAAGPVAEPITENTFTYWVIAEAPAAGGNVPAPVAVYDPIGNLSEALDGAPAAWGEQFACLESVEGPDAADSNAVLVATVATPEVVARAKTGGKVVLLLQDAGGPLTEAVPFFREGIALIGDHAPALTAGVPHRGYAGVGFSAVAADRVLDPAALTVRFGTEPQPVVSRLDARQFLVTHYLSTLAVGKDVNVVVTTLRLTGGDGRTPVGFRFNVLGRHLFAAAVRFLSG